jgi:hypothetical protein
MTQAFQLVFLVAAGLVLLARYKEHSTGKAGEVYLLFITMSSHHHNPSISLVVTLEVMASSFKFSSFQME